MIGLAQTLQSSPKHHHLPAFTHTHKRSAFFNERMRTYGLLPFLFFLLFTAGGTHASIMLWHSGRILRRKSTDFWKALFWVLFDFWIVAALEYWTGAIEIGSWFRLLLFILLLLLFTL
jgi:hypothetical protein